MLFLGLWLVSMGIIGKLIYHVGKEDGRNPKFVFVGWSLFATILTVIFLLGLFTKKKLYNVTYLDETNSIVKIENAELLGYEKDYVRIKVDGNKQIIYSEFIRVEEK